MNNIESRVLEMKFDNEQFESAVATTMSTLDKFKDKLKFKDSSKGLRDLGAATSNYQYTLQDVGESLANLEKRFSTMGTIGARIFEKLTDSAYGFVARGIGNIVGSITQGGMSRAMNLEQARFQMQGILKDSKEVHRVIYDDILPELQGTPFSLDQAAVVIGQLVASGKESSEEIKRATRGMAGLAAMTGHQFSDVGRIFTKVAGNGVMMAEELNQLSGYGVNAAADLSKFYKQLAEDSSLGTEQAIEDMEAIMAEYGEFNEFTIREAASKRLIHYDSMAAAMDLLYGEHAQKSTQMYTGALEDLKAALARIGAEPAALRLNFLRDAFNALVPAVDAVNAVIKPFWNSARQSGYAIDQMEEYVKPFTGPLAQKVQKTGWAFQKLFVKLDENNEIVRATSSSYKKLGFELRTSESGIKTFYDAVNDIEYDDKQAIMNPTMLKTITSLTQSMVNVFAAFGKILKAISLGVKRAFPKPTLRAFQTIAEYIEAFTKALIPSEETLIRISKVAQAVMTPVGLVFRGLIVVAKLVVKAFIGIYRAIKPIGNAFMVVVDALSVFVIHMGRAIRHLFTAISNFVRFGASIVGSVSKLLHLDKVLKFIQNAFQKVADVIWTITNKLSGAIEMVASRIESITNKMDFDKFAKKIAVVAYVIGDFISTALHLEKIKEGFQDFWKPIKEFFAEHSLFDTMINVFENLVQWIAKLIGFNGDVDTFNASMINLRDTIASFTIGPASKIKKWLGDFGHSIAEFLINLDESGVALTWATDNFRFLGFIYNLGGKIKKMVDPLSQSAVSFAVAFMGFKNAGEIGVAAGNLIKKAFQTIVDAVGILIRKDQPEQMSAAMNSTFNSEYSKKAKQFGENMRIALGPLGKTYKEFGEAIRQYLNDLDPQVIKKFIVSIVLLITAMTYLNTLRHAQNTIKGIVIVLDKIADIPRAIGEAFTAFKNLTLVFRGFAKAFQTATIVLAIAASAIILAAAFRMISDIEPAQLAASAVVLGLCIGAIVLLFTKLNKIDFNNDGKKVAMISAGVLAVSAAMLLFTLAVKSLADIASENKDTPGVVVAAMAMMAGFVLAFAALAAILKDIRANKSFMNLGWGFVGIAQGMKMMAEACAMFVALEREGDMEKGLGAMLAILVAFSVFAASNWNKQANIGKAAFGMIGVAIAVQLIAGAIKKIGESLTAEEVKRSTIAIDSIVAFFGAFAVAIGFATKLGANWAVMIGLVLSMSLFIKLLGEAMVSMGGLVEGGKLDKVSEVVQSIIAMFAVITLISTIGGINAAAGPLAIAALASALWLLTEAIIALSNIGYLQLIDGFYKLGFVLASAIVALLAFGVALETFSVMVDTKAALSILAVAAAMTMFVAVIYMMAALPIDSLMVSLMGLVGILAGVGLVMAAFSLLGPSFALVGVAFLMVGAAALFVGAGLFLVTIALSALIPLIVAVGKISSEDLQAGINILLLAAEGLKEVFYRLADGVLYFGAAIAVAGVALIIFAVAVAAVGAAIIVASLGVLMLAGSFAVLASVLDAFVPQIKDSVLGTLGTLISKVGEFFGNLREEKGQIEKEMSGMKDTAEKGGKESTDAAKKSVRDGGQGIKDEYIGIAKDPKVLSSFTEGGKEGATNALGGMSDIFSSEGPGILNGSISEMVGPEAFSGLEGQFDAEAVGIPSMFGDTLAANAGAAAPGGEAVASQAAAGASSADAQSLFNQASLNGVNKYSSAMSNSSAPKTAGTSMAGKATDAADSRSVHNDAESAGENLAEGFSDGIDSGTMSWVVPAAESMARAAINAANRKLRVNSPSKVFIEIGKSVGEGFVMGIVAMNSDTEKATEDLMGNTIGVAAAAIDSASKIGDVSPTITPVVDLTNVDQSIDQMNSMFGTSPLFSTASAAMMASSFVDLRNQNDRNSAINRLANKLDSMTETMNSRSLNVYNTIDGASDPEAFADGLIRSFKLNARTT